VTTAQTYFMVAFAIVAGTIGFFALYVLSSTVWSNRWYRRRR
jgi:hypothetical protein